MARRRAHLRNAPIAEAVIDFRVLPREGTVADLFATLGPRLGAQYSTVTLMQSIGTRFAPDRGRPLEPTTTTAAIGWQYRALYAVAQFRMDGFTFSRLEPYTTWDEVFAEARRLWSVYVETARPTEVIRIAVRYINRLRVPVPTDLREYLEAPPVIPAPAPQNLRQFLCRVVVDDPTRNASAVVVQASELVIGVQEVVFLIDIDAFRENLSIAPTDLSLPEMFLQLRDLKNEIFFANITEKTVEMYE